MDEFSPRTYPFFSLFLNIFIIIIIKVFVFHKRTQSSANTREKSSGQNHEISVRNSNSY